MAPHIYRFGNYRIDLSARELHCAGELATLSPKVFDCLAYLIEHRDRAVGRDELIAAVWGKVDVSDTLLGQTVLKARRAIGDTGNEQHAIRTIPRFGYRWIAELQIEEVSAPATTLGVDPSADVVAAPFPTTLPDSPDATEPQVPIDLNAATRAHPLRVSAAVLLFLIAAIAGWQVVRHRSVAEPANAPSGTALLPAVAPPPDGHDAAVAMTNDVIAVLPVTVGDSGDGEWAWLRLGLMDLIATRLRRGGQPVVPSDNVVALTHIDLNADSVKPGDDPSMAICKQAGARYALKSHISHSAQAWQIRLELNGIDGSHNEVQMQGNDPVEAARSASDRLLLLLGKGPPTEDDSKRDLSLTELLQRTEAALLGDDFATARRLIESAPPTQRDTPTVRLRLAQIDFRTGNIERARASLETLSAQVSAETDPALRARALQTLGAIAIRDARNTDAVLLFEQAIALTETRKEPKILGASYAGLAIAMMDMQRFEEAASALARARVALSLAGDTLSLARVDDNEGLLDNARGRPAEALPALQRAADTFRRFGIVNDLGLVAAAQIDTHLALLDSAGALAVSESFLAQRPLLTNPRVRNSFDLRRARALAAAGRLTDARTLLYDLQQAPGAEQQAGLLGVVASELAMLDLQSGNAGAAAAAAKVALARLIHSEQAGERAKAWLTLVRALRATKQQADAREQIGKFAQWTRAYPRDAEVSLLGSLAEAEQVWVEHGRIDLRSGYAAVLDQAERRGVPADIASVVVSYGNVLIANKELDSASAVIGRIARWADHDFNCALLQVRYYQALGEQDAWKAALQRARGLAGERPIPKPLSEPPGAAPAGVL